MQAGEMKLGEAKKLQNVFKLNINEISKARWKSKEQNNALENIKLPYESWEAIIRLFNDYSWIVLKLNTKKKKHGKVIPSMSTAHVRSLTTQISNY